jgi:hypothetical protein
MANSFGDCFAKELELIRRGRDDLNIPKLVENPDKNKPNDPALASTQSRIRHSAESGEPIVDFNPEDTVGLCLSGGGIRSATFNLGLLQGLNDLGVLKLVDYVSTVSGGGYIGGWWSAWRSRDAVGRAGKLPNSDKSHEPREVRHLREFSRFLIPRIGFFEMETWNGITAVLGGMLPSLVTVFTLVYSIWWVLILSTACLLAATPWLSALLISLASFFLQLGFEHRLRRQRNLTVHKYFYVGLVISHAVLWFAFEITLHLIKKYLAMPSINGETKQNYQTELTKIFTHITDPQFELLSFVPGISFAVTAAVIIIVIRFVGNASKLRPLLGWFFPDPVEDTAAPARLRPDFWQHAVDRIVGRMIAAAALCLAFDAMWCMACALDGIGSIYGSAGAGAIGALLFGKLRHWMFEALQPGEKNKWLAFIKPLIPQLLAYATVIIFAVLTARLLIFVWESEPFDFTAPTGVHWNIWSGLIALAVLLGAFVLFNPVTIGMHNFYRGRITRAYLGASNINPQAAEPNRLADEQSGDDVLLRDLNSRPIHLVCCAANNLSGDALATLNRGARSYVASPIGLSMGDAFTPLDKHDEKLDDKLLLSSFLTASAAAFNSNMGSISSRLGPAAAFLMSAMNLRLGLWAPNPGFKSPSNASFFERFTAWLEKNAPGFVFFEEMFGNTNAGPTKRQVHLSDGGHFENLGLYELIRRHCRYIIVSDCGADPDVLFDDFGNASRRIREDFGVEIEIDLGPLKACAPVGKARQHMVVGTIDYGGECDKGIILFFKPNMTGDEPVDVEQYYGRNTAFPNESTGDQFYDEAQWEAYRRLGAHSVRAAMRFVQSCDDNTRKKASDVFRLARQEWYPTPEGLEKACLEQSAAYADLEDKLRDSDSESFVREFFPELAHLELKPGKVEEFTVSHAQDALQLLLDVVQFMEDTWLNCKLPTSRTHPLNVGWINLFQRWANAETFRFWWPIVRAMFTPQFRDFVERDLDVLGKVQEEKPPGEFEYAYRLVMLPKDNEAGMAWDWFKRLNPDWKATEALSGTETEIHALEVGLPWGVDKPKRIWLQVCVAIITLEKETASWDNRRLFIPPSLWAGGFGRKMLDRLIPDLQKRRSITKFRVNIKPSPPEINAAAQPPQPGAEVKPPKRTDAATRAATMDDITFYKSFGFFLPSKDATTMDMIPKESSTSA